MGKFHNYMQILQGNALFSGTIYTVGNIFTQLPVVTIATNFKSVSKVVDTPLGSAMVPAKLVK